MILGFRSTYISDSDKEEVIDALVSEGVAVLTAESCNSSSTNTKGDSNEDDGQPRSKRRKLGSWLATAQPVTEEQEQQTPTQNVKREIIQYESSSKADPDKNPLEWWKIHNSDFMILSKLAKKYLCVMASSAPSERVFSTCGLTITNKRTLLKPERVNQLVFLSKNL